MDGYFRILFAVFIMLFSPFCFSMQNCFYVSRNFTDSKSLDFLHQHSKSIDMLISQAYHIDKKGVVSGFISPEMLAFAQKNKMKLMAMVTNASFDTDVVHQFLASETAKTNAIDSLLTNCQQQHLQGVQFDFERVSYQDKALLTRFFQQAASVLHEHHFQVSFAVTPVLNEGPFATKYQERFYKNSMAFDLAALSRSADFITVMAYDQHAGKMSPGPIAGAPWVEQIIRYSLKFIPRQKFSLGIPVYSGLWYTGMNAAKSITLQNDSISFSMAQQILVKNHARLQWDSNGKVDYAIFNRNWLNEYIFLEDKKSFNYKYNLAKKYHLRGISVFRIGTEDPGIWKVVK